jgi:hypothetical protein
VDPFGLFTVDESCKDCAHGIEEIKKQVQQMCDALVSTISDLKLRQCLKRRCDKAKVICRSNDDINCKDNTLAYNVHFLGFRSPNGNICIEKVPKGSVGLGFITLHEWAHSCGWDHGDGGGVPGNDGVGNPMTGQ